MSLAKKTRYLLTVSFRVDRDLGEFPVIDKDVLPDLQEVLGRLLPQEGNVSNTTVAVWKAGTPIAELDLTVRAYNVLRRHGIDTVEELVEGYTYEDIADMRNMGWKSLEGIIAGLDRLGYQLRRREE